ncbi:unnamed protein product [Sphagnum troendelagicum]|uniref:Uncharacterized protein n=1 Tax=Sphagnum troendelagicum TaxID=128251 RepID=A0ABP0TXI8_9BRYO
MNSLLSLLPFPSPSCHTSFPSSSKHDISLWAGWSFTQSAPVVVVRSIHDDGRSLRIWPRLHHHHHHRHHRNDYDCMRRDSWSARRGAGAGVGDVPSPSSSSSFSGSEEELEVSEAPEQQEETRRSLTSIWKNWQTNAAEMRVQVAKLGLAAVLAYGLFDGVTYTSFFVLAFLGYEKSTGQNPAANLKALLGIVILMWTGNNVTRPLRVAGAAVLAPFIDKFLKKTQKVLNLPNQAFAFMIVVASFASLCLSVVGVLILSRWGK